MKLFISQPMKDKTNVEIEAARNAAIEKAKIMVGEDIKVIDSFVKDAPHDARPLWFLGKSLELLSTADYAMFLDNWFDYRGCNIEHKCCKEYGIKILED